MTFFTPMTCFHAASPIEPMRLTPPKASPLRRGRAAAFTILLAALPDAAGCGRADGRTQVSGTVIWRNEPVKQGSIMIEPDSSQGNLGPQSMSAITDGSFQTRPTHGSVSGPVVIEVMGYGEQGKREFLPPLFPPYRFKTEIPKGKATLDIVVPNTPAAEGKRSP